MVDIKKIETKEDMVKWATAINSGPMNIEEKCTYQDIWGRSSYNTIKDIFVAINGERPLVVHSMMNVLNYEAVEDMFRHLIKTKAMKVVNEEMDYYNAEYAQRSKDLDTKQSALKDSLKTYWKRITSLKKDNAILKAKNESLIQQNNQLQTQNKSLYARAASNTDKAEAYDTIKRLLA